MNDHEDYWYRALQRKFGTFCAARCMWIGGYPLADALRVLAGRR